MRKDIEERIGRYKIDEGFEAILKEFNDSLKKIEKDKTADIHDSGLPVLFFCYAPRTGSTLISQILATTREFSYVSNFIARFWEAPYITLLIENKMNLRNLGCPNTLRKDYRSEYGVTKNIYDPHEFGFFWNKFIPYSANDTHFVGTSCFTQQLTSDLHREITAMVSVYNKPFFFKNAIAGLNCHYLQNAIPNSFFIIIKRDVRFVAQSILLGRRMYYGSDDIWFSLRPKEYRNIIDNFTNPYDQIALQLKGIYKDIENGIKDIRNRCLEIKYEDFCCQPREYISKIFSLIKYKPIDPNWFKAIPDSLPVQNLIKLEEKDFRQICMSLEKHNVSNN